MSLKADKVHQEVPNSISWCLELNTDAGLIITGQDLSQEKFLLMPCQSYNMHFAL